MSGITTIKVKIGEYKCSSCLEETIDEQGLLHQISIEESQGVFKLEISKQSQDYYQNQERKLLEQTIKKIHNKILPLYTEKHAIHSLVQKGFSHVKSYKDIDNYKLIFEKITGVGANQNIMRYTITVIPKENKILIDGGNMPGQYCRQYSRKFQRSMGEFENFVPHTILQSDQQKVQNKIKQYERIGR